MLASLTSQRAVLAVRYFVLSLQSTWFVEVVVVFLAEAAAKSSACERGDAVGLTSILDRR